MARYGEQTYRQNFNRKKKDCIDWLLLNLSLARRVLDMDGLLAIAIDPCYIKQGWEENSSYRTVLVGMCRGGEART